MASRSERANALRQFAGAFRAFHHQVFTALERLRGDLAHAEIDEEDRAICSRELESGADNLTNALAVMMVQCVRIEALAQALDDMGMERGSSRERESWRGSIEAPMATRKVPAGGFTGETIPHGNDVFEVWSLAGIDPARITWSGDAGFPQKYYVEQWKGRSADDYRELVRMTAALLEQCRAFGTAGVANDLRLARDAYFGTDRIRLEIGANGQIVIANGRHRVMAAIEAGASIPVSVWRAEGE
jgi:hypothetical protein